MSTLPNEGLRLTETIREAHPEMPGYTLYPGDLLVRDEGGTTWMKEAPGLAIGGFVLTPEQEAALEPVRFAAYGLDYVVEPSSSPAPPTPEQSESEPLISGSAPDGSNSTPATEGRR